MKFRELKDAKTVDCILRNASSVSRIQDVGCLRGHEGFSKQARAGLPKPSGAHNMPQYAPDTRYRTVRFHVCPAGFWSIPLFCDFGEYIQSIFKSLQSCNSPNIT